MAQASGTFLTCHAPCCPPCRNRFMREWTSFDLLRLRDGIKPFRLLWYPLLRSTNDHAAKLRKRKELFAPALVLAGRQTAGRGRGRNTWWSAPGTLTATFVLPGEGHLALHQIPLAAGLAVRDAAARFAPNADIQLKWPNDVVCDGGKLAGLLCERISRADLIGVGLNVNIGRARPPAGLRAKIVYLAALAQTPLDMTAVLITIAGHLHAMLSRCSEQSFGQILARYQAHDALVGKRVVVTDAAGGEIAGICLGLDTMGRLVVEKRKTILKIITGQVRLEP